MQTIEIKTTKEKVMGPNGKDHEFDLSTLDMIRSAVNNPPAGGYAASDMLDRLKILEEVDKQGKKKGAKTIELEDDLYRKLAGYVKDVKWSFLSRTITDFVESFK